MNGNKLKDRMKNIRRAVNHPDLTERERRLLATIVTYMSFDNMTWWPLSRRQLAEDLYGRDNRGSRANVDKAMKALVEQGFVHVQHNIRDNGSHAANSYMVEWERLTTVLGKTEAATATVPVAATEATPVTPTDPLPVYATEGVTVNATDPYRTSLSTSSVFASEPRIQDPSQPDPHWPPSGPGEEGSGGLPADGAVDQRGSGLWVEFDEHIGMGEDLTTHAHAQQVRDAYRRLFKGAGVTRARLHFRAMNIAHHDLESVSEYLLECAREYERRG